MQIKILTIVTTAMDNNNTSDILSYQEDGRINL